MTTRVIVFAHVEKDRFSLTAPISDDVYPCSMSCPHLPRHLTKYENSLWKGSMNNFIVNFYDCDDSPENSD